METPADRPVIRRVYDEFRRSDFRFKEMIAALMRARATLPQGGGEDVARNHKTR
jgi:hypothetical protein